MGSYGRIQPRRTRVQSLRRGDLTTRLHSREDKLAVLVYQRTQHPADGLDLRSAQTCVDAAGDTAQTIRLEMTQSRVADNSVLYTINPIALPEHFPVHQCPLRFSEELRRPRPSGDGEETRSPGCHVVEVDGRRADENPVKVVGESGCGVDALAAAQGAAHVVSLAVGFVVERFDEVFAHDYARAKTA